MIKRPRLLLNQIKNSLFLKHVISLGFGTIIAHLITLSFYPIISRLYSATEIGEYSLFHSTVVILSVISTLAYEHAIVIPKHKNDAKQLFLSSFFSSVIISGILLFAGILLLPIWKNYFGLSSLFIFLLPLGVMANSMMNISINWFTRETYFKELSLAKIFQTTISGSSQTFFALLSFSGIGMILGHIGGRIAFVVYQFFIKFGDIKFIFSNIRFNRIILLSKLYSNQPKYVLASTLLTYISIEIPIFLIGILFNKELLGFYGLAYRIVSAPIMLIGTSVGHVFFQQISARVNEGKSLTSFLFKTWAGLAIAGLVPFLLLYLYAVPVITFALGDDWETSGIIVSILTPYLFVKLISSPTARTLMVINKQRVMPLFSFLYIVASAASLIIGAAYLDFFTSIWLLVFANILIAVLYNIYIAYEVYMFEQKKL